MCRLLYIVEMLLYKGLINDDSFIAFVTKNRGLCCGRMGMESKLIGLVCNISAETDSILTGEVSVSRDLADQL